MQIEEARLQRSEGRLREAVLEPAERDNAWHVVFIDEAGRRHLLTDALGRPRRYHDLDRATCVAREAGFDTVRVEEPF
ncbi:MAG TPA: hypothetical protein ENK53_07670 [Thiotrichales bacterium]|nr:hypothetical protein [Thiotrichales bacterium]